MSVNMSSSVLNKVCKQVYRQFPEMAGVDPKVQPYAKEQFLLIFQVTKNTANGHSLSQVVRAVSDANGKIAKISISH